MSIVDLMRFQKNALHLSCRKIGDVSGMTSGNVTHYLSGRSTTIQHLDAMLDALRIEVVPRRTRKAPHESV